jgi:hypothetical protein
VAPTQDLPEQDARIVAQLFAGARRAVKLTVFRRGARIRAEEEFLARLAQIQGRVPGIDVEVREYADGESAVERAPAVALSAADGTDLRVRFYGWPSGYELGTLITAAADAARADEGAHLQAATVQSLAGLRADVHVKVFTTPT